MNLREVRKNKKLTQLEAAKQIGVPMATYILWERGATTPNPENQIKIDQYLRGE